MEVLEARGRPLVPGRARGRAVVVELISFYGDVDWRRGTLRDGRSLAGAVLVARRSRGSTVGSYVIYAMASSSTAPAAIVMERAEPIVVAGCVLGNVPLVDGVPWGLIREGDTVEVEPDGTVRVTRRGGGPGRGP